MIAAARATGLLAGRGRARVLRARREAAPRLARGAARRHRSRDALAALGARRGGRRAARDAPRPDRAGDRRRRRGEPSRRRSSGSWPGARIAVARSSASSRACARTAWPDVAAARPWPSGRLRAALAPSARRLGRAYAVGAGCRDVRDDVLRPGSPNVLARLPTRSFRSQRERAGVRRDHDPVGGERDRARRGWPRAAPCRRRGRRRSRPSAAQDAERAVEPLRPRSIAPSCVPRCRARGPGATAGATTRNVDVLLILDPPQLGEQLLGLDGLVRDDEHARHASSGIEDRDGCYKRAPGGAEVGYSTWPTANETDGEHEAADQAADLERESRRRPWRRAPGRSRTTIPNAMTRIAILPSLSSTCPPRLAVTAATSPRASATSQPPARLTCVARALQVRDDLRRDGRPGSRSTPSTTLPPGPAQPLELGERARRPAPPGAR